jgi:hypothetical protein
MDPDSYLKAANILAQNEDFETSVDLMRKYEDKARDDPRMMNNLLILYCYLNKTRQVEEYSDRIRQHAKSTGISDPTYLYNEAQVLVKKVGRPG